MRKMKQRRLGATPEEHNRRIQANRQGAGSYFTQTLTATAKNRCSLAFTVYTMGAEEYARASENKYDAGRIDDILAEERLLYKRATDAFIQKCLVGGGLSGLGRRPSRRRK
jgi:hypothetical protein